MFSKRKNSNPFSEGVKILFYCPVCGTSYNPLFMKILEETDGAHLVHIECQKCGTLVLALIVTSMPEVSSRGVVTDLKSPEVIKFKDSETVDTNDVIDIHFFLKKERNPFLVLIK